MAEQILERANYQFKSIYWYLDHALRLVPSLVHDAKALYEAVRNDAWLFDAIILTDIDSDSVAEVISAQLGPLLAAWKAVMDEHEVEARSSLDSTSASGPVSSSTGEQLLNQDQSSGQFKSNTSIGQTSMDTAEYMTGLCDESPSLSRFEAHECVPKVILVVSPGKSESTRRKILASAKKHIPDVIVVPDSAPTAAFRELVEGMALRRAAALHRHDVAMDPALRRFRYQVRTHDKWSPFALRKPGDYDYHDMGDASMAADEIEEES